MGSYQDAASAVPNCAPHLRRSGRTKLGKGTSSTRADKAAIKTRLQALRYAFAPKQLGQSRLSPYFAWVLR
jgi:hypothetical protein